MSRWLADRLRCGGVFQAGLCFAGLSLLGGCQAANRQSLPVTEVRAQGPLPEQPALREVAKPTLPEPRPTALPIDQPLARVVTSADGVEVLQPALPVMEALAAISACTQSESHLARALRQMKPENIDRAAPNFARMAAAHQKFLRTAAEKIAALDADPALQAQWRQIQQPSEADAPRVAALRQQQQLTQEPLVSPALLDALRKVTSEPAYAAALPAVQELRDAYLAAPESLIPEAQRQALTAAVAAAATTPAQP